MIVCRSWNSEGVVIHGDACPLKLFRFELWAMDPKIFLWIPSLPTLSFMTFLSCEILNVPLSLNLFSNQKNSPTSTTSSRMDCIECNSLLILPKHSNNVEYDFNIDNGRLLSLIHF